MILWDSISLHVIQLSSYPKLHSVIHFAKGNRSQKLAHVYKSPETNAPTKYLKRFIACGNVKKKVNKQKDVKTVKNF